MRIAQYWSFGNWALLFVGMGAEAALLIVSLRRGLIRRFAMLPALAAFGLATDLAGLVIALSSKVDAANGSLYLSRLYYGFYWLVQIGGGVLLLLLAMQAVSLILPPISRVIALLAVLLFTGMAVAVLRIFPGWEPGKVLRAVTVASAVTIGALAITWVIESKKWPEGMRWIVAGLIASQALQGLCTMAAEHYQTMQGFVQYGVPFAGLAGMGFYFVGVLKMGEAP